MNLFSLILQIITFRACIQKKIFQSENFFLPDASQSVLYRGFYFSVFIDQIMINKYPLLLTNVCFSVVN